MKAIKELDKEKMRKINGGGGGGFAPMNFSLQAPPIVPDGGPADLRKSIICF
jgi:bacteriocin-like protein